MVKVKKNGRTITTVLLRELSLEKWTKKLPATVGRGVAPLQMFTTGVYNLSSLFPIFRQNIYFPLPRFRPRMTPEPHI